MVHYNFIDLSNTVDNGVNMLLMPLMVPTVCKTILKIKPPLKVRVLNNLNLSARTDFESHTNIRKFYRKIVSALNLNTISDSI